VTDLHSFRGVTLGLLLAGCAARPKTDAAAVPLPHPSAPTASAVFGLDDATGVVKMYDHDTVDPDNAMPTVGGYVRVRAPLEVALEVATRFGEYRDLNPDYIEQSTVVDRHPDPKGPGSTDLYLKVPTVIGEYVWAVVRFAPIDTRIGYAFRGDEVSGNLDDLRIYWRLVPAGPNETIAQFEFLADPHLPIPRPWILPEVREGVRIILTRFKHKTEAAAHPVPMILDDTP
jgi:hypothetical protein